MAWNWYNQSGPSVGNGGRATAERTMHAQLLSKAEATALIVEGANSENTGVYLEVKPNSWRWYSEEGGKLDPADYGTVWRFWRGNPEIELMQMTPWEESE